MLPVSRYKDEIQAKLNSDNILVFTAPPGSGKSTQLPLFVSELIPDKEVVVLQPRRIAARMLAYSVVKMNGFKLGEEVGYQVRGEKKRGKNTSISYRTDGLFLRQLINKQDLNRVSAVILDEFHERNWQTDIILPILLDYQKSRENFHIVVMSATMETEKLCQFLKATLLECKTETYPVEIYYRQFSRNTPLWERAVKSLADHLSKPEYSGDILIFMPGVYEINRTVELCRIFKGIEVFALHGSLSPEKQDEALRRGTRRKVIVCTNIAETSLTVEGVDTVIDAGYAKVNRYDAGRGIDSLNLEPISVFSAEQRAGRAGRLGPGRAYRLWSREEHSRKSLATAAEVFRIDISEVLLQVLKAGYSVDEFSWYERPGPDLIERAHELLVYLRALDTRKSLNEDGLLMADFPCHPRIGRFLIEAHKNHCFLEACFWAAIISERSPVDNKTRLVDKRNPSADLSAIVDICNSYFSARDNERQRVVSKFKLKTSVLRSVNTAMQQFCRLSPPSGENFHELQTNLIKSLLAAYIDRLAVRVDRGTLRYRFANGKVAELSRSSSVRDAEFIIGIEIIELNSSGDNRLLIGQAAEVPYEMLEEEFLDELEFNSEVCWNDRKRSVEELELISLNGLILKRQVLSKTSYPDKLSKLLAEKVLSGELKLNSWNSEVEKWMERVRWVAGIFPEKNLKEYSKDDIQVVVQTFCTGYRSFKEIKNINVLDYFKNLLSWDEQQFVLEMSPLRLELGNGRKVKVKYENGKTPKISGYIQDFYDVNETPAIADGRVKVLVEMLAPSRRPVHLTDDLEGFWNGVYKDIKAQLAGRYPKHKWI